MVFNLSYPYLRHGYDVSSGSRGVGRVEWAHRRADYFDDGHFVGQGGMLGGEDVAVGPQRNLLVIGERVIFAIVADDARHVTGTEVLHRMTERERDDISDCV